MYYIFLTYAFMIQVPHMDGYRPPLPPHAAPGSQLKDMDLVRWLEVKLGDHDESGEHWSGRAAAALLSREMIEELETCFQALEPHVKLRIVLAIPHINPRLLGQWSDPLTTLINLARRDADDWIETVADMYRELPTNGEVLPSSSNPDSYFEKALAELTTMVKAHEMQGHLKMLPVGIEAASQAVIRAKYGIAEVETVKHFNLRRKAKSSQLKADLLRTAEQLNNPANKAKNGIISSFPIRVRSTLRKPNNDLPMRGIPTVNTCKLSAGFTNEPKKFQRQLNKREGGAKLIDICEIPQSLKKRKLEEAKEDKKKKLEEKEAQKKAAVEEKEQRRLALIKSHEDAKRVAEEKKEKQKEEREKAIQARRLSEQKQKETEALAREMEKEKSAEEKQREADLARAEELHTMGQLKRANSQTQSASVPSSSTADQKPLQKPLVSPTPPVPRRIVVQARMPSQEQQPQQPAPSTPTPLGTRFMGGGGGAPAPAPAAQPSYLNVQLQPTVMSREEEVAKARSEAIRSQCDEMLRSANRLDAQGHRMVMRFMSGDKFNPRPDLGEVVTLKLSENIEDGIVDGHMRQMKVETFFQMDYVSGEWKRLRKCRLLSDSDMAGMQGHMPPSMSYAPQTQPSYDLSHHHPGARVGAAAAGGVGGGHPAGMRMVRIAMPMQSQEPPRIHQPHPSYYPH